jgi:WD40 repeat protein
VDFSKDGKFLVSGGGTLMDEDDTNDTNTQSSNDKLLLWKLDLDKTFPVVCQTLLGHHGMVRAAKFSPDDQKIASASEDGSVIIWSVSGSQLMTCRLNGDSLRCVAWSPDGKLVATGGQNMDICLWDSEKGVQVIKQLMGHKGGINCVAFGTNKNVLVSASGDKTIMVWELSKKGSAMLKHLLLGHSDHVLCIALSPDDLYIASASEDKTIRLWNVTWGQQIAVLEAHPDHVNSVVWSPDGRFLVSCSDDQTVRVWDIDTKVCGYTYIYIYIYTHTHICMACVVSCLRINQSEIVCFSSVCHV